MKRSTRLILLVTISAIVGLTVLRMYRPHPTTASPVARVVTHSDSINNCQGVADKTVIVSISKRHLWACNDTTQAYDSPVITGMEQYPADLTPTGTYHIYGKYTNTVLSGHDSTGSWNDPVSYWMPWLHNQYGSYGFHDATWRDASAFGAVDPASDDASHGCVELPLATAKWIYDWSDLGATVVIRT